MARIQRRQHRDVRRALRRRHAVQPAHQPPLPAGHRRARQRVRADASPDRLDKEMGTFRAGDGPAISIAIGHDDEQTEADTIALEIETLHDQGVRYRDIAILVRGRAAYARILDALEISGIPVQPGGRTGLFQQPEAAVFGATFAWLADIDWAPGRFIKREKIELLGDLLDDYRATFGLDDDDVQALRAHLTQWQRKTYADGLGRRAWSASSTSSPSSCDIDEWDLTDVASAQPARHRRPLHRRARRLRVGHPSVAAGPEQPGRAGRRRARQRVVLPQLRAAPGQLRDRQLRRLRRRGGPPGRRRRARAPSTAPRAWSGRSCSCRR